MPKYTFPRTYLSCTFLLFKASAFLQIFLQRKTKFWERQLLLIVNVWHSLTYYIDFFKWNKERPLKKSHERTHIILFSNLFIYLIELEHP